MANLVQTFQHIFKIEELRTRIIFTILVLIGVRIGAYITLPGVNVAAMQSGSTDANTLFGLYDMFVGGAFSNAAIFALGIMPYISASIIFQLAGIVMPQIQKMQREGEEGRRKLNQWTRLATVPIAALQAWGMAISMANRSQGAIAEGGIGFYISAVILLTSGTIFLMWLGEQITERGIGNGISLIIFIGIIARLPAAVSQEFNLVIANGGNRWLIDIFMFGALLAVISAVVLITQGARRIPVQYAKRVVGNKQYGGQTQYIPLRVNTAGVMPIIFAQSLMFIPNTLLSFAPESTAVIYLSQMFSETSFVYAIVYAAIIIFFTYFYTAIIFNPKDTAENMKKNGGFIPGVRPGKATADYIENILTKITLPGSIFLALIAILPTFVSNALQVPPMFASFFGGTSLLIVVGVALDSLQQIESYLLMRHYDGFMKSGKIRGRATLGVGGV
ncbi:MAG: preprotein translocase subunit SecY [Ignavibacteria bacterium]|jgi:preprotein translocase subunit SecY|nr:preprotein translocase subunit SecY [Ignavibacteria bacterium]